MIDYAVIAAGGKQHRVRPGDLVDVERIPAQVGDTVEIREVLLLSRDGRVVAGRPLVEGARVVARVEEQFRGPKVVVFKYKAKTRYRRKRGHRQPYTRLRILEVALEGEAKEAKDGP